MSLYNLGQSGKMEVSYNNVVTAGALQSLVNDTSECKMIMEKS